MSGRRGIRVLFRGFAGWVLSKARGYLKENWGAPFVLGFMVLLIAAAVLLSMGLSVLANDVAVYAYYALVAGVVLQFVCFFRYRERGSVGN